MSEIVTVAQSTSNAIRSHGFPVLEAGNISFPQGRYAVQFNPGNDQASFVVTHRIQGAPLISRLLGNHEARYVCAVSSPVSSYRRTHVSSQAEQRIQWDQNDLGEAPLFTPMIVSVTSRALQLSEEHDGVHRIWNGQLVRITKGSRLALGHVVQLRSSILQLLSLHADKDLAEGQFFVDAETEQGFQFRVSLHPKLHQFLQFEGTDGIRGHLMTHVVTACLALLQRDFHQDSDQDGGWASHRNLRAFADFLKSKGLPHWSEDDFRPEQVATALYRHTLPNHPTGGQS